MALQKGDFVEINYSGKISETGLLFDTTSEQEARQSNSYDPNAKYGAVTICIGEGQLLKGLENFLIGKEPGKYAVKIESVDAFGKKNAKLLQLIAASKFKEQKVQPMPGLQVNIDGMYGVVKSSSGGRVVVDFNHPLAGKDLTYEIEVIRIVNDVIEKLNALMKFYFKDYKTEFEGGNAKIALRQEIPIQVSGEISQTIKRMIPEIKSVEFTKF